MSDLLSKCSVCGALVDEEDLFCANCGTEVPPAADAKEQESAALESRSATHNFECGSCGASMSYNASERALVCPFCSSVDLRQQKDQRVLAPQSVVPFAVDQSAAVSIMRRWLGTGFWRPGDLARQAKVVKMQAVYVPYWVFQAQTHTYWTADTNQTPLGARGDWYPLSGEHHGSHAGLLVGASGALSPQETHALCPFDLSSAQPPDSIDLDNVTVEQFSQGRKFARPLARQGLEELERTACDESYIPGRSRNVKVNVRIQNLSSEPVLLPVWITAYRYQEQVFRFLVNGQSGKATGRAPTSWKKITAAVVIGIAAVALLGSIALIASR